MAVSDSELARALFPKPKAVVAEGTGNADLVTVAMGHAIEDSSDGTVSVVLDMDAMGIDAAIDVPTGARIKAGDDVLVTVSGNSAVDAVAAGWGDALADRVDGVTNYFWHDEQGAHVSTVEGDATSGPNVLVDSDSLDIREGTDVLASFDADGVHLYTADGTEIAYFTDSVVKIGEDSAQILMPYSTIESMVHSYESWVNWAISRGWRLEGHSYESGSANFAVIYANPDLHRWALDGTDSVVYMETSNAVVQAEGLPVAHIGVRIHEDSQVDPDDDPSTYGNHESEVSISGQSIAISGASLSYGKTMDDFIRDLIGARGVTLFESANGTNSTISIGNYDFADFDRVTIMYGKLDGSYGGYQSQTVYNPNGKSVILSQAYNPTSSSGDYFQIITSRWTFSGNQLIAGYNGVRIHWDMKNGNEVSSNRTGEHTMLVYRIVGYSTKTELDAVSGGDYVAGDGISISGNVISADVTTQVLSDALDDYVPVVDTMSYSDIQSILV